MRDEINGGQGNEDAVVMPESVRKLLEARVKKPLKGASPAYLEYLEGRVAQDWSAVQPQVAPPQVTPSDSVSSAPLRLVSPIVVPEPKIIEPEGQKPEALEAKAVSKDTPRFLNGELAKIHMKMPKSNVNTGEPLFVSRRTTDYHARPYMLSKQELDMLVNSNNPYLTHLDIKPLDNGQYRVSSPDPVAHKMIADPQGMEVSAKIMRRITSSPHFVMEQADFQVVDIPFEDRVGDRAYRLFTTDPVALNLAKAIGVNPNEEDISSVVENSIKEPVAAKPTKFLDNVVQFPEQTEKVRFGGLRRLAVAASVATAAFFGSSDYVNINSSTPAEAGSATQASTDLSITTESEVQPVHRLGVVTHVNGVPVEQPQQNDVMIASGIGIPSATGLESYFASSAALIADWSSVSPNIIGPEITVSTFPPAESVAVSYDAPIVEAVSAAEQVISTFELEPIDRELRAFLAGGFEEATSIAEPADEAQGALPTEFAASEYGTLYAIAEELAGADATPPQVLAQLERVVAANIDRYPSLLDNPDRLDADWVLEAPAETENISAECRFSRFAPTHCRIKTI